MVMIRFTAQGSNSMIGGFSTGDYANVGDALARHLVEEAHVAIYIQAAQIETAAQPEKKSRKRKSVDETVE